MCAMGECLCYTRKHRHGLKRSFALDEIIQQRRPVLVYRYRSKLKHSFSRTFVREGAILIQRDSAWKSSILKSWIHTSPLSQLKQ